MNERARRLLWLGSLLGLLGATAFALWRFVLRAPAEAFHWQRDGIKYELLEPRALAVWLVAPVLLFVLGKSLADLPWQQRALSVLLRLAFMVLLGLGLSRLARSEVERLYQAKGEADLLKVVAFAARPRAVPLPPDGKLALPKVADLRWKDAPGAKKTEAGSNIQ